MYCRSNSATCWPFFTMVPPGAAFCSTNMKSLPPPLSPPLVLGSESEVLPRPLDPSAEELDPPEPEELDEAADEGALQLDELPTRLVAEGNAEDAFAAELDEVLLAELALAELEDELEEEPLDGLALLTALEESRPKPLRLPIRRGVMSEAKFAAEVATVSGTVRSTGPGTIRAVRMAEGAPGPPPDDAAGRVRSQRYTPPATMTTRRTTTIHRPHRLDFLGRGGTTSGRTAGGLGG